jgi:DMSO/TMAO reductase YedYZ molybdopterin-dependent catalytic subunit
MTSRPRTARIKPAVTDGEIRPDLIRIGRRAALRRGLSLGGLALLTGCDLSTHSGVDAALWAMLRFDDRVQAALFSRRRLARTYPVSAVTRPFRFNSYYEEWQVREMPEDWQLEVSGLVADKAPWTLEKLRSLPNEAQVTRHICIEGWSQIGQWSGVPLHVFLQRVGADLRARYVSFKCFDGYSTSIACRVHCTHKPSWHSISSTSRSPPNGVLRYACEYRPSLASRAPRTSRPSP